MLLGDHTIWKLNSNTIQAVALGVRLFPALIAPRPHSTLNTIGLLRSPLVAFTPATMQPGHSQRSIGKDQRVEEPITIDTFEGASIGQVRDFLFLVISVLK